MPLMVSLLIAARLSQSDYRGVAYLDGHGHLCYAVTNNPDCGLHERPGSSRRGEGPARRPPATGRHTSKWPGLVLTPADK